ncbi:hypothetical protein IRJ41_022134 [Triplophysa rosa]|uniref:Uncharacterized protein n=1 Tax=Triplophysa rosa TaxID=992332 RepID=A0A9W7X123_TRIRA|nr:hypothetical protein IRJ41_022134 [Triplophysa rosa]
MESTYANHGRETRRQRKRCADSLDREWPCRTRNIGGATKCSIRIEGRGADLSVNVSATGIGIVFGPVLRRLQRYLGRFFQRFFGLGTMNRLLAGDTSGAQ